METSTRTRKTVTIDDTRVHVNTLKESWDITNPYTGEIDRAELARIVGSQQARKYAGTGQVQVGPATWTQDRDGNVTAWFYPVTPIRGGALLSGWTVVITREDVDAVTALLN